MKNNQSPGLEARIKAEIKALNKSLQALAKQKVCLNTPALDEKILTQINDIQDSATYLRNIYTQYTHQGQLSF